MGYEVDWCCSLPLKKGVDSVKLTQDYEARCKLKDDIIDFANILECEIDFEDYCARYNEEHWLAFCDFIAPYVEDNSYIEFKGEDSTFWKFLFKNNKYKELTGNIVYNNYVAFMDEFKKEMPDELREQLMKWYNDYLVLKNI